MSLKVLLRDHPERAIALATDTHALVFRHSPLSTNADAGTYGSSRPPSPKCIVEFSSLNAVDLTGFRDLQTSGVHGTLGLINIKSDVYLCIISGAVRVATVRPGETIQRILSVVFYCLNKDEFDHELLGVTNPYSGGEGATDPYDYGYNPDSREAVNEHPCIELTKILSSGTFYYSVNFDLTNRLQDRLSKGSTFDVDSLDEGFLWNSYMIDPLIKFRSRLARQEREALDESHILTSAIRGFVLTITIPASSSPIRALQVNLPSMLTLISRLSCRRAGTRFNSRGIDDDGHVANFVESETVYWYPSGLCFSYVQVRGSIPLFWEQATNILPGQQKIQITRSPEATQPAFDKHFELLQLNYGMVHILNLLSAAKSGEVELTKRYSDHIAKSPWNQGNDFEGQRILIQTHFDFHAETKGPGGYEAASMVKRLIQDQAEDFAYFLCDDAKKGDTAQRSDARISATESSAVLQQTGVFRTNCLDCLDRTNLIQTILSQMALESFLIHRSEYATADFWMRHSTLWADNGDALSKIYAGTGALKSSFTRHGKMSLAGAIADARKSATRMYINNFADKGRQNTIDMLLVIIGRLIEQSAVRLYDPVNEYVNAELKRRADEYSRTENVQIWVGTFNLNGKGRGTKEDLSAWLCPEMYRSQQYPEVVAVGFQEIVELSPQQIMSTDPIRRQAWEIAVGQTLNDNARKYSAEEYVLVRSGQLVGAALMVFVKTSVLKNIKNVEGSVKKTGFSGMAGNKGAVAIRMDYANTRICFVTAHFAAGFTNYEERNRDYRTISHGLRFQRNRSIEDHDTIIWLGDFNYRIGLSDDKVRRLINLGDVETLYQNDQLNLQMMAGRVFQYYSEARVEFLPTYKYNNGTDDYDTSDKARIPAWCDRVLRKGDNLRQMTYATAPLRFSDHRPVYATFQCTISIINEAWKEHLSREIYGQRRLALRATTAKIDDAQYVQEHDLINLELPPASSDRRKWWLDNGLPAQSTIEPPRKDTILNSQRPSNPFSPTNEPDWVVVSKNLNPDSPGKAQHKKGSAPILIDAQKSRSNLPSSESPSSSRNTKKPGPPIPRKPSTLSSSEDRRHSPSIAPSSPQSKQTPVAIEAGRSRLSKSPRPSTDLDGPPQSSKPLSLNRTKEGQAKLPPPPRRHATPIPAPNALLDDEDDCAHTIPSLQPLRRN